MRLISRYILLIVLVVAILVVSLVESVVAQRSIQVLNQLQNELEVQQVQIDSLRNLLSEFIKAENSRNTVTDAMLEPVVQSKVDKANEEFLQQIMTWIVFFVSVGMGAIIILFVIRYQLLKRLNRTEETILRLKTDFEEDLILRESDIIERQHHDLHELNARRDHNDTLIDTSDDSHIDHTLPLRVADEIHRMRKRMGYMEDDLQSVKALRNSLKRLENELNTGGYEVVDLVGKKYVDGLNVEARFVPSEGNNIEDETITDIIRPQVNYRGIMIQQAKVEVSKSYS